MAPATIQALGLSTRAHNLLRRNGIGTVAQLRTSLQALPLLHGCGAGVLYEILTSLEIFDGRQGQ
jgi:hypothetical protein